MRLILLGPPGAGKGTLATLIKEKYRIPHISTGDIFREEMKSGSKLGKELKGYVDSGELVPDDVVTRIIENKLINDVSIIQDFMLDGFPRTKKQAGDLDRILKKLKRPLNRALYMETDIGVIVKRLTGRRVCRKCGAVYHIVNRPPKKAGVCDHCGGKDLYQRADDNESTIKNRLDVYLESTLPIVDYYEAQGILKRINGGLDAEHVLSSLANLFDESKRTNKNQVPRRN